MENSRWEWEDTRVGFHSGVSESSSHCTWAGVTPAASPHSPLSTATATGELRQSSGAGLGTRDCCPCAKAVQDQSSLSAQLTSTNVVHCKSHIEFFQSHSLRTKVHMFSSLTNHVGSWRREEKLLWILSDCPTLPYSGMPRAGVGLHTLAWVQLLAGHSHKQEQGSHSLRGNWRVSKQLSADSA